MLALISNCVGLAKTKECFLIKKKKDQRMFVASKTARNDRVMHVHQINMFYSCLTVAVGIISMWLSFHGAFFYTWEMVLVQLCL